MVRSSFITFRNYSTHILIFSNHSCQSPVSNLVRIENWPQQIIYLLIFFSRSTTHFCLASGTHLAHWRKKIKPINFEFTGFVSSPSWARTNNPSVNSRMLCHWAIEEYYKIISTNNPISCHLRHSIGSSLKILIYLQNRIHLVHPVSYHIFFQNTRPDRSFSLCLLVKPSTD